MVDSLEVGHAESMPPDRGFARLLGARVRS
jgi:hypothetical protein